MRFKTFHLNALEQKLLLRALDEHLDALLNQSAAMTAEGMAKRFARDVLFHLKDKLQ